MKLPPQKNKEDTAVLTGLWMKFFIAISIVAFMLVTYALFKETYKKYQIQKEVEDLKREADNLEKNNQKLRGLVEYFKTENYSEKEAREKLNLQKEGEKVVVLRSQDTQEEKKFEDQEANQSDDLAMPNPLKWWDYFFRNSSSRH